MIRPQVRNIVREVGQPSFIEAYERTSIFAKPTAYIEKWIVDIGDKVKKGDVLATLFVPELVEDHETKGATVGLDRERIALAKQVVRGGGGRRQGGRRAARGGQGDPGQVRGRGRAVGRPRSSGCSARSTRVVVDARILAESTNQLKASHGGAGPGEGDDQEGGRRAALPKRAALAKAEVDVKVAEADLKVAESEERRLKAWVGYLTLTAPYRRRDHGPQRQHLRLRPAQQRRPVGQHTGTPDLSPSGSAAPIYVVDRTDVVRIFVDVPEAGRQLHPHRHQGERAGQGVPRRADPGDGHPHVLGAEHEEPDAPRRDRPARTPAASSCPGCTPTPR